jgi:hypothetical protein
MAADPASTERAKGELEVYRRCKCESLQRLGAVPLTALSAVAGDVLFDGTALAQMPKPIAEVEAIAMAKCVTGAVEQLWSNGFVNRDIGQFHSSLSPIPFAG